MSDLVVFTFKTTISFKYPVEGIRTRTTSSRNRRAHYGNGFDECNAYLDLSFEVKQPEIIALLALRNPPPRLTCHGKRGSVFRCFLLFLLPSFLCRYLLRRAINALYPRQIKPKLPHAALSVRARGYYSVARPNGGFWECYGEQP
jgi:hypothetical protein